MAVYVDNMRIVKRGKAWCHLVADSLDELHNFAQQLGLPTSWFHRKVSHPHYDITVDVRDLAIARGAIVATRREVVLAVRAMVMHGNSLQKKAAFQLSLL